MNRDAVSQRWFSPAHVSAICDVVEACVQLWRWICPPPCWGPTVDKRHSRQIAMADTRFEEEKIILQGTKEAAAGPSAPAQEQPQKEARVLRLDDNAFDVYIRMKGTSEQDLCFKVTDKTSFRDLLEIFTVVPINFTPSIFYDQVPIGFSVSYSPGILTRTGTILFDKGADKKENLKRIRNLDEPVFDHCVPGQLIVPTFQERTFLYYAVISFFLVWLYTDLPDFVSPTPGICMTNQITKVVVYILNEWLHLPHKAQAFHDDIHGPVGVIGQCIFFLFHIGKTLMLYFILWAGLFNPYSLRKPDLSNLSRDDLLRIGWTGTKKAESIPYQDSYRKLVIAKYGSIMKVYEAGKFAYIRNCFIPLDEGEGYNSFITKEVSSDVEAPVRLTSDLLFKERAFLNQNLMKMPYADASKEVRRYRSLGPVTPCPELAELVKKKFAKLDHELSTAEAKKNPLTTSISKATATETFSTASPA